MNTLKNSFGKFGLVCQKYSPEIFVAAGTIGVVVSAVGACKATMKLNDAMEPHKDYLEKIHNQVEEHGYTEEYTEEDAAKEKIIIYTRAAVDVAKLYAPSVAIGALSLTSIIMSHRMLSKRNAALAAAYTVVDKGFKEYRGRVIEKFGEAVDHELKYNVTKKEVTETTTDKKGKEKEVTKTVEVTDPNTYSDYARFFDESCCGWDKDAEFNLLLVKHIQSQANDALKSRGYLFLNDVYEMLDIPKTKAGYCVGWIYDEKNPVGDNYIDFGIYDVTKESVRDFVNGYERSILLDFNVDGPILDLI